MLTYYSTYDIVQKGDIIEDIRRTYKRGKKRKKDYAKGNGKNNWC